MNNSTNPEGRNSRRCNRRKTASQLEKQKAREALPGWDVRRRTMGADGTLNLACEVGAVKVDVQIGRKGAETAILRDPDSLLEAECIASLITARSGGLNNA